ncbi:MAG TPA: hypothetical protein VJU59_16720 [Paraburkholderia sp.]|uniref:hypothetical protein n=1 Tax=Paraburkholderia sp. TaxID=1926495 RepID=UPI002B46310C|nr:hypothetical protein [Paraburkholderia sp.]HKR41293.1 hypothetical protein [Paraburkholderia sp.]
MNKPYINVEAILDMFKEIAQTGSDETNAADSLTWLTDYLAREHSAMNANDWNGLLQIGAVLYRAGDRNGSSPGTR